MGTLDIAGKGVISTLEEYLSEVLKPALKSIPNWGELDKSPSGKKLSRGFVEAVDTFIGSLHGLLQRTIHLPPSLQTTLTITIIIIIVITRVGTGSVKLTRDPTRPGWE